MTAQKSGPLRSGNRMTAQYDLQQASYYNPNRYEQVRCPLHGCNIVDELPKLCPLGTRNPLETIWAMKDSAWRGIGRGAHDPEFPDSLHWLDRADICIACIGRESRHRNVQRIRQAKGFKP